MILAALLLGTSPIAFGAVADDGVDDGAAFRAAVAQACMSDHLLEVPAGVFHIERAPGKTYGITVTACNGLSIIGKGRAASHIRMVPRPMSLGEDFSLINIDSGSVDVEIAGLTLDGQRAAFAAAGASAEQVHLIRTNVADRIDVHDADLIDSFGDCMKNIDADDVTIINVRCRGSRRDGINSHNSSEDVRIVASSFSSISDQHVATEGAGGNRRWILVGNSHGPGVQTGIVVDIGDGLEDAVVMGSIFLDGGMQLYNAADVAVVGNVVSMAAQNFPPLYLKGGNRNAVVVGNVVNALGTDTEAACFRASSMDANRDPSRLVFVGNACRHAGKNGILLSSGTGRLVVDGNLIENVGAAVNATGVSAMSLLPSPSRLWGMSIGDNVIEGEDLGVSVKATRPLDGAVIGSNVISSARPGARGVVTEWGNTYGTPAPSRCVVGGNVIEVQGAHIHNAGASAPAQPGEGCLAGAP